MNTLSRTASGLAIAATIGAGMLTAASAAHASGGGGGGVHDAGSCSQMGTFRLTAKPDDALIEVEYEVDTNVAGQTYSVRLTDNGVVVLDRSASTHAPSGSFTIRKRITDRSGIDHIHARAVAGGNTCRGAVQL